LSAAQQRVEQLSGVEVEITAKAGTEGKLYGSIGTVEIAAAVSATGNVLEKREVRLPDGPLREVGEHHVTVHLHADAETSITVHVIAEEESIVDSGH
jgi:large subunit ribosomal protein L9